MIDTICLIIVALILIWLFIEDLIFNWKIKRENKKLDKYIEETGSVVDGILKYDEEKQKD